MADEIHRFHDMLHDLSEHLLREDRLSGITPQQLLQGPFADAMTHAGQLALLRRLHGSPVPPENSVYAEIDALRLGENQPEPHSPDAEWPKRL